MKKIQDFFKNINLWHILYLILGLLIIGLLFSLYNIYNKDNNYNINKLLNDMEENQIEQIEPYISQEHFFLMYNLSIKYKHDYPKILRNINKSEYNKISEKATEKGIDLKGIQTPLPYLGFEPLIKALSFSLQIIFIFYMIKILTSTSSQLMEQFSDKNKTQQMKHSFKQPTLTFKDVAGAEEEKEELQELADFLKNPKKYYLMGARIPKGVLLSGPPGTGKTLLAKALAGEAKVPFFAVSGSEFVEMFVGLGASRIRSLFKSAQKHSPCIIFIDEIETLARKRGMAYGNTEQEQTLNQLLIELDGYNQNEGVIVIAATNQPDFLDPALLRPGRFDRRFIVNLPSVKDREAILRLHALNKKMAPDVDLEELARITSGFSGAQLEGILNEAALLATRNNLMLIDQKTISEATDRILIGLAKKSVKYSNKEKKLVSYHEAGHALIGVKLPDARKVQKVTIIPRGISGGYNLLSNEEENFFSSKKQLLAEITSLLGGRAAEELFLDDVSNGAYQDFKMATNIAKKMVTIFGMSDLGLAQFEEGNSFHKTFSDPKALEIDQTIQKIIWNCYELAKKTISDNKECFLKMTEYLLEIETLNQKDIQEIAETNKLNWFDKQKEKDKFEKEIDEVNTKQFKDEKEIDEVNTKQFKDEKEIDEVNTKQFKDEKEIDEKVDQTFIEQD
ncbi:MAG: ATP-dependent zinc metalloprotease FtsH [Phytoplasma sp.]|uniref:ATP-dependent zinc metalloprotease FtsH n=1 Tax=Phytoplasma sp. TaxID=2155 RepID=UPI002B403CCA|nr:ATP-dependent zinc metalloprotease FtsH [Phytoplasma sp.]WRH06885.1 MAG: ATP-dependent zinc metalloprotease FtsH [Phytoplasma sp.]